MGLLTSLRIVLRAGAQFGTHGASQMGAALAYYALFSTVPMLLLAIIMAQPFFGESGAKDKLNSILEKIIGPENAHEISTWMERRKPIQVGSTPTYISLALLLFGTLGAFLHLRNCLSVIWNLKPPSSKFYMVTLINYLLSLITVMSVGLLLLFSLFISTSFEVLVQIMNREIPGGWMLWRGLDLLLSFLLLSLFFAIVYRVLSGRQIPWSYVWYGAFITSVLFLIGKAIISVYLAYSDPSSMYGAACSLVIFLVWVYYSSQIVFFGAELIQARRTRDEWMKS